MYSFWSKLSPLTRLAFLGLLFYFILLIDNIIIFFYAIIYLSVLLLISKAKITSLLKFISRFVWLFLFLILLNLFNAQGKVFYIIPYINWFITYQALNNTLLILSRFSLTLIAAYLLWSTITPLELLDNTYYIMRTSFGREIIFILYLAFHFIPLMKKEAIKLQQAQLSRGIWKLTLKQKLIGLFVLFERTWQHSQRLALVMTARGFDTNQERSCYIGFSINRIDIILIFLIFTFAILISVI